VYTYATAGSQQLDVPGSRHEYPGRTYARVTHAGCGVVVRWQPLEGRWDELETCTDTHPPTLRRVSSHRQFFGRGKRSDYQCEPGGPMWRPQPEATWTVRCGDDQTTMVTTGRTVAVEPVEVGGVTVNAVHYHLEAELSGDTTGSWSADRWVHADTGLLLRLSSRTDVESSSPMGRVRYQEQLRLDLASLAPER
jgi:hypothetical protein